MVRRSLPLDAPVVSHRTLGSTMVLLLLVFATRCCLAADSHDRASEGEAPSRSLRSLIWCWGNPEMATDGRPTLATFATASPAARARLLGVPNVIMAGNGLPDDQHTADTLTQQVAQSPRLVWEIAADGGAGPPFVYDQRIAQVRKLVKKYPQIEGVLLDDMSSVGIDKGFRPQHIGRIHQLLGDAQPAVKIWGVLYTMNFNRPGIEKYVQELDVINLWTWHAKDLVDLEKNVAYCEHNFPGKPIVLGLYLYDYGAGRRMPPTLLEKQCVLAQRLAHAGRIEGIVLLTITDDPEAVGWAADWVGRVGDEPVVD